MFISCVTLILLFSIVRCRPIYPLSLKSSENEQNESNKVSAVGSLDFSDNNNAKMDLGGLNEAVDSVNIAHPPEGVGIFRDPLEVLGPKFPAQVVQNLCHVNLFVNTDVISKVVFPDDGKQLCEKICKQYHKIIILDGPTDVSLMQGYCDYTGIVDFSNLSEQDDNYNLSTECTCAYKVRCNQRTNVIMYTFQTNSAGYLKVVFTESNKKACIT